MLFSLLSYDAFPRVSYFDGETDSDIRYSMANYGIRERSMFLHGSKWVHNFNLFFFFFCCYQPSGKGPRLPEVYCVISRLGCFDLFSKVRGSFYNVVFELECLLRNMHINEPSKKNFFLWWGITVFCSCCFGYSISVTGFIKECLMTSVTEAELDSKDIWVSVSSGWLRFFHCFPKPFCAEL